MSAVTGNVTQVQKAFKLHAVPSEKWPRMVQRTLLGLGLIGFGAVGAIKLAWPWFVAAGFVLVGSTVWSGQLVTGALMALLTPLRAYKRMKDDTP